MEYLIYTYKFVNSARNIANPYQFPSLNLALRGKYWGFYILGKGFYRVNRFSINLQNVNYNIRALEGKGSKKVSANPDSVL
jgi:hypothetical protein